MENMKDFDWAEGMAVTAADGCKVIKLGINFSRKTKTIDKWIAEKN